LSRALERNVKELILYLGSHWKQTGRISIWVPPDYIADSRNMAEIVELLSQYQGLC
jgi:hypothetical protein